MEKLDILVPPRFSKSGVVKTRDQAVNDEDWVGTFNLLVVQSKPEPAVIYQLRSPKTKWAPNKLDVTAGGHYQSGENLFDGLREIKEEIGRSYDQKEIIHIGRKLNVTPDILGKMRYYVSDILLVKDNSPLTSYKLQEEEVAALFICPIEKLLQLYKNNQSFEAKGINAAGKEIKMIIKNASFPGNWDNFYFKIIFPVERFLKGEKNLIY